MKKKIKEYIELIALILLILVLAGLFIFAFKNARVRARDVKTVDDIKAIQNALALYRYDTSVYPTSEEMGSGRQLSYEDKIYLQAIPKPLEPNKNCQSQKNYIYETFEDENLADELNLPSYSISFCLNYESGTLEAGLHTATPSGIK
jgi:type II secretory pathway pseudopilin PulG